MAVHGAGQPRVRCRENGLSGAHEPGLPGYLTERELPQVLELSDEPDCCPLPRATHALWHCHLALGPPPAMTFLKCVALASIRSSARR